MFLEHNFSFKYNFLFEVKTNECSMTPLALYPLVNHKCHMKPWKEPHQSRLGHWELQGNHTSHTWLICGPVRSKYSVTELTGKVIKVEVIFWKDMKEQKSEKPRHAINYILSLENFFQWIKTNIKSCSLYFKALSSQAEKPFVFTFQ